MSDAIYLIDGSAYIYRSYHAIQPLTNSKGVATNAVFGFVKMVHKLIKEKSPRHLAIAFDSKGPVFRHQIYRDYKANRPPMPDDLREQIPYIKRFVAASSLLMLEKQGVEADDILASVVHRFAGKKQKVILVTGDKDLLQLVGAYTVVYDPMKDLLLDTDGIRRKYGVSSEQLLDFFALVGDASDNVPGVPGVGPKTAGKLIGSYGSLDGLYAGLETMKASKLKEKIVANREQAYLSRQLIDLKVDVDVPASVEAFAVGDANGDLLAELYKELEFSSLLADVDTSKKIDTGLFELVCSNEQFQAVLAELETAELMVIDTETTSLDARQARLVGLSLCTSLQRAYYIPLGHLDAQGNLVAGQLDKAVVLEALRPYLQSEDLLKIGHNLKYDYTVFKEDAGIALKGPLADTLLAAYLTESGGRSLKLDDLCRQRGLRLTPFSEVTGGDAREESFAYVPLDKAADYSCEDVYGTLVLWEAFSPLLEELGLASLFWDVEMPVLALLAEMEITGIRIDPKILDDLEVEFSKKLQDLQADIFAAAGHEFNINSPRQLGTVLFEEQGLPHGRKTKTGYSTDVKVLEKLAGRHELPRLVLNYRTLAKLLSTYVVKLKDLQDPVSGRVHTSFNQAVTATGRLSSSDPNLQNIPIRSEDGGRIRDAFVPDEGMVFLSADYSQIDLRVLAHYSKDPALVDAFVSGDDIHRRTATEIFNVSPLLVNAEMRRIAKSINFGIVYGMSSYGLSTQLGLARKEAQRFIDTYFHLYRGVQQFMVDIVESARENSYVTTLLGRRRTLSDIRAKNRNQREFAERMAINTPIQGTAADIIKLAMIRADQAIQAEGLQARMLLQIHDELVFELPEKELARAQVVIKRAMEGALELVVPLVVNFAVGKSLAK
ncbi:MAG: DNA polymerase I [Desulfobacterales bacterium]|nr:MAG: DNA polymerase I [Desulfobacterales bacterium]